MVVGGVPIAIFVEFLEYEVIAVIVFLGIEFLALNVEKLAHRINCYGSF